MYSTMGTLTNLVFALICVVNFLPVSIQRTANFEYSDVEGLQSLWAAWNSSTPNIGTNLAGWHNRTGQNDDFPCYNQKANWRGVTCLRYVSNATTGDTMTWVIGLTLSDASIGGTLPSGISWFQYMVTLTLTGNPNLAGPLPKELGGLPLNVLDLHDNNFNGQVPAELSSLQNLLQLDFSGNQLTGPFPSQFNETGTLQEYSIARNHFSGEIPPHTFEGLTQLITLDISSNAFTGALPNLSALQNLNTLNLSGSGLTNMEIPTIFNGTTLPSSIKVLDLSNLTNTDSNPQLDWSIIVQKTQMEQLYLDYNSLRGTLDINNISSFNSIAQKSKSGNSSSGLKILSLKNNSITNVVTSSNLITSVTTIIYLQGNPYCNYDSKSESDAERCYCKQVCLNIPVSSTRKNTVRVIIIAASVSGSIMILLVIIFVFLLYRSRKHLHDVMKRFNEADVNPRRFDYQKLRIATRNFSKDMKLGAGAFGAVYKGILSDNNVVAVKQLFMKNQKACNEFINEVILIINLQHRNLVNLKGYCLNGKEMLLIYEYVDNQDLDKILLGAHGDGMIMTWQTRYNICLGVAHGLFYLHSSTKPRIIHRDIKASNILLDKDLNPKIADFGLARPILDEKTEIMTQQLAGTKGYVAPEYTLWGQLSEKADVFSFGVLLLEIVSGRRNIDLSLPEDEAYLPNYALKLYNENNHLMGLVDSRLHVPPDKLMEVQRVLETALLCVQTKPEKRPTMFTVVSMLVGDSDIKLTRVQDPNTHDAWPNFYGNFTFDPDNDTKDLLYAGPSSSSGASVTRALLPHTRSTNVSNELNNSDLVANGRR